MSDTLANFRELTGIGPATEAKLHEAGVYTWTALAEVLHALIKIRGITAYKLKALSEQAAHLAADPGATTAPGPPNAERSEAFILRLSVQKGGRPTRSTVTHVRSRTENPSSGWSPREVIEFIEEQAGLTDGAGPAPSQDADELAPGRAASDDHVVAIDAGKALGGRPRTVDLVVSTVGMSDVGEFVYRATLTSRPFGATPGEVSWVTLGQRTGNGDPHDDLPLRFDDVHLAPGVHRLRLDMALTLQKPQREAPVLQLA
jgi:hypothetical protein